MRERLPKLDTAEVIDHLDKGLTQLREALVDRMHQDVEREMGMDSMLAPLSLAQEAKQLLQARGEIEAYACMLIHDEVTDLGIAGTPAEWLREWAFRLRCGEGYHTLLEQRVPMYRDLSPDVSRQKFTSLIYHTVPESKNAPSVLFVLFPYSVRIITALAFGDKARAAALRKEQCELLQPIGDCPACHAHVLEPGKACDECGNPVWTYKWLLAE